MNVSVSYSEEEYSYASDVKKRGMPYGSGMLKSKMAICLLFLSSISTSHAEPLTAYCGVKCVWFSAALFDKKVQLTELVVSRFIGSPQGSDFDNLKDAASYCGLFSKCVSNVTPALLKNIDSPVILHVKSSNRSLTYDHYILHLQTKGNYAQIVDPNYGQRLISYEELFSISDGNGMIVSDREITLKSARINIM